MPGFDQFPERVDYYGVLHMNPPTGLRTLPVVTVSLGKRFGDDAYAVEELIAELGSAYTMARLELELTPWQDHAAYIRVVARGTEGGQADFGILNSRERQRT